MCSTQQTLAVSLTGEARVVANQSPARSLPVAAMTLRATRYGSALHIGACALFLCALTSARMMDSGVKQKLTTETRRVSSGFGGDGWWTLWLCGEGVLEENRRDAKDAEEEAAAGVGTGALSGANHRDTEGSSSPCAPLAASSVE
jgi:hypothetical protein